MVPNHWEGMGDTYGPLSVSLDPKSDPVWGAGAGFSEVGRKESLITLEILVGSLRIYDRNTPLNETIRLSPG